MTDKIDLLANELYTTYCKGVGGTAHDGSPLPTWEEFSTDLNKDKQASAWRLVAMKSLANSIESMIKIYKGK